MFVPRIDINQGRSSESEKLSFGRSLQRERLNGAYLEGRNEHQGKKVWSREVTVLTIKLAISSFVLVRLED